MRTKTALLFGIHMHQPVDNFDWVIDHAIEMCYGPFFEVMSRYPQFRFSLHCSGWLMERIEAVNPKLYAQIRTLARNGSIEMFSAGYYEPILSAIPSADRTAQIKRMNDSISERFDQTPRGLWLTERVWESSLICDLVRSGIDYTVMDDYHFQCAGFEEEQLDGYYLSEEGGETIALFPISKKLRYALPFYSVERAVAAIKSFGRLNDSAAIIFDDAEKFGMWPGTHEWVYAKGWLERFVQSVLADESIETIHYGEYAALHRPRGIAYLPNVSYYEMGEWSLRPEDALKLEALKREMGKERFDAEGVKFLKGGTWKNFFVKYPESNRLHKRMLELSRAREALGSAEFDTALFKLQTNDPLWHGVFGGLYLPNLRDSAYRYLIECENLRYGEGGGSIGPDENELDGYRKFKAVTPKLILRFDEAQGGQLVELDERNERFNWQNTLTRRREAYHQRLFEPTTVVEAVEEGIDTIHNASVNIDPSLRDELHYDWYLKNSFIDHISDEGFSLERFYRCDFREYGDFANQPFEGSVEGERITFVRDGGLYFPEKAPSSLRKTYTVVPHGVNFELTFATEAAGRFVYVQEHNFHFADYDRIRINGTSLGEKGSFEGIDALEITDVHLNRTLTLRWSQKFDAVYFQLKTLSQSEKGVDLSVQGISLALIAPFEGVMHLLGSLEISDV